MNLYVFEFKGSYVGGAVGVSSDSEKNALRYIKKLKEERDGSPSFWEHKIPYEEFLLVDDESNQRYGRDRFVLTHTLPLENGFRKEDWLEFVYTHEG